MGLQQHPYQGRQPMEGGIQNMFWNIPTGGYVFWNEQFSANVPTVYEYDIGRHTR